MRWLPWSGRGWLVPIYFFVIGAAVQVTVFAIAGEDYFAEHSWTYALTFGAPGIVTALHGRALYKRGAADGNTSESAEAGPQPAAPEGHRFLWIPMEAWGYILCALAALMLLGELT